MKSIYPFLLLLTLSFQSFYSEAKSHFTDKELIVYNTDLYASDHTPIAFKLTKRMELFDLPKAMEKVH